MTAHAASAVPIGVRIVSIDDGHPDIVPYVERGAGGTAVVRTIMCTWAAVIAHGRMYAEVHALRAFDDEEASRRTVITEERLIVDGDSVDEAAIACILVASKAPDAMALERLNVRPEFPDNVAYALGIVHARACLDQPSSEGA